MKKVIFLLLALLPMMANADKSGNCYDNLRWTYVEATQTLTISGTGYMNMSIYYDDDTDEYHAPWYSFRQSIKTIIIENGVTSIGEDAFTGCSALTSITIPNSVTSIDDGAFSGCTSLTSIIIGNSVSYIADNALSGCTSLTSIKVRSGNTVYDSRDNCNAIIITASNALIIGCKNTTIPNSVTSIAYNAFSGCSGLTSIVIPNSVTSVEEYAFSHCI